METNERLDYLEQRLDDHRQDARDLRDAIRDVDRKVGYAESKTADVDRKLDERFAVLDAKLDELRKEVGALPVLLSQRLDNQFKWLVGLQFAVMIAVIGALFSRP